MSDNIKLSIEDMNLFYGNFHALHDINMHIPEKEITAFIGPSGCGKSTLLKSLNRMNDLVEGCKITGKVELDGEDIYGDMDVNISINIFSVKFYFTEKIFMEIWT